MKHIFVKNDFDGSRTACWLDVGHYSNNGNLAVQMYCDEGPFATITVNTSVQLEAPLAAVKTYAENEFVPAMLRRYKIAEPKGFYADGMPVYKFDMDEIAKYGYKPPKKNRYDMLREALNEAKYQAEKIAERTKDDGTCNLDSVYIQLPRFVRSKVITIAKDCGLSCEHVGENFFDIGKLYGMAQRNTVAQRKFADVLNQMGFKAYVHYFID